MSTGVRMPLEKADRAAAYLMRAWGMTEPACAIVGSVRRRRDTVGDLELIAPLPEFQMQDTLFEAIDQTCKPAGIFASVDPAKAYLCEAVEGLKRGFKACSLVATLKGKDTTWTMPVQIFRYTAQNRGWIEAMRTGPGELGRQLLVYWKKRFDIPRDRQASVEGHLVDAAGLIVPVPTELDLFRKLRIEYIAPSGRDAWVEDLLRTRGVEHRDRMR